MSVVWTASAKANLIEISDYISADNPARAKSFVHEIVAAGEALLPICRALLPWCPGLSIAESANALLATT
jgi:hypothetical protein